jgi:hypothetical protein
MPTTSNLLSNPGFEAGSFSGWTTTGPTTVTTANPNSGTYSAQIASSESPSSFEIYQTVSVAAYATSIDDGTATASIIQYFHLYEVDTFTTSMNLGLQFLDSEGATIDVADFIPQEGNGYNGWQDTSTNGPVSIPVGTRSIKYILSGTIYNGSLEAGAFVDDSSLTVTYVDGGGGGGGGNPTAISCPTGSGDAVHRQGLIYVYPETIKTSYGTWSYVAASSVPFALDDSPIDNTDNSYTISAPAVGIDFYLTENTIVPSSIYVNMRQSNIYGEMYASNGETSQSCGQVDLYLYNDNSTLIATGQIPSPHLTLQSAIMTILPSAYVNEDALRNIWLAFRPTQYIVYESDDGPEEFPYRFTALSSRKIYSIEVALSGTRYLPESSDVDLFLQGPCMYNGHLRPYGTDPFRYSNDIVDSGVSSDVNKMDCFSNRFTVLASGNGTFLHESGVYGSQVAFYGWDDETRGMQVGDKTIRNIEFWSNLSNSGFIKVSGSLPGAFYEQLNISGSVQTHKVDGYKYATFSGVYFPHVEVKLPNTNTAVFDFKMVSQQVPNSGTEGYHRFAPTLNSRGDLFILTSGATDGRLYKYQNTLLKVLPFRPMKAVSNVVNDKLYILATSGTQTGFYTYDIVASSIAPFCTPITDGYNIISGVQDFDIDYYYNKLVFAGRTQPSGYQIFRMDSLNTNSPAKPIASTYVNGPSGDYKISVYDHKHYFMADGIQRKSWEISTSDEQNWFMEEVPINAANGNFGATTRFGIDTTYFQGSGLYGTVFLDGFNTLIYNKYNDQAQTVVRDTSMATIEDVAFDEYTNTLYAADISAVHLFTYSRAMNEMFYAGTPAGTISLGGRQITALALRKNKNFTNTSNIEQRLERLGDCCPTVPSGFIHLEANYLTDEYYGYPDGEIRIKPSSNYFWRSRNTSVDRIERLRNHLTVGYDSYEINDTYHTASGWRNANILLKVNNFARPTVGTPTGLVPDAARVLLLDNYEYIYEDCLIVDMDESLDLFTVAGKVDEMVDLHTISIGDASGTMPLYMGGGYASGLTTLYMSGFMRTENDNITLHILPQDTGYNNKYMSLYTKYIPEATGDMTLMLLNIPQERMNLFIAGTPSETESGNATLFTRSAANSSIFDTMSLTTDCGFGENLNLFIDAGNGEETGNIYLQIGGQALNGQKACTLYVGNDYASVNSGVTMYMESPEASSYYESINLFMSRSVDSVAGIIPVFIKQDEFASSGFTMMIKANTTEDGNITLFMPSSVVDASGGITLYTHGF